jgi:hypothetical protein
MQMLGFLLKGASSQASGEAGGFAIVAERILFAPTWQAKTGCQWKGLLGEAV